MNSLMRFPKPVFAAALALTAQAADPPDAPALIRQSIRAAEAHASYEFESDMIMDMTVRGNPVRMTMSTSVSAKPPDRIRMTTKMPMGEMLLVSDGQYLWTHVSAANQYTKKAVSDGALDVFRNFGFGSAVEAEAAISRARVTGQEEVTLDGAPRACWMVEIPFGSLSMPAPAGAELRNGKMQAWIDQTSGFVLRLETTGSLHLPGKAGAGEIRQSMSVRRLRVDAPLPDSLFAFTPPEGAREVAEFGK
jgi:outer membrane lipoprotein-sorting protein